MTLRINFLPSAAVCGLFSGFLAACGYWAPSNPELCPQKIEEVCAVVEPEFCQLADCGFVEKTYDNICIAQQAGAKRVTPGACGYHHVTVEGQSAPKAFRRETAAVNPVDPERLRALYAMLEGPLELSNSTVKVTNLGVTLFVSGTIPMGCGKVELTQNVRLGDSFGITMQKTGADDCGGELRTFEEYLVLDAGRNKFVRGVEYEIVVNGRIGRFIL